MKNVVLTRIDDRLIHGQVVTGWVKKRNAAASWWWMTRWPRILLCRGF